MSQFVVTLLKIHFDDIKNVLVMWQEEFGHVGWNQL